MPVIWRRPLPSFRGQGPVAAVGWAGSVDGGGGSRLPRPTPRGGGGGGGGGGGAGALRARSPTNEYIDTAGLRGDRKSVIRLQLLVDAKGDRIKA
jgi:hypothetical protein